MRWLLPVLLISAALGLATASAEEPAQLYKCKGSKGETVFSDQPCPGGEALPMKETPTFEALPPPSTSAPVNKNQGSQKAKTISYKLVVTKPTSDEVLRDNEGNVAVEGVLSPQLGDDHKVRILLDGQAAGEPATQPSWNLSNVERGEHTVAIDVFDTKTGKSVQTSPSVKFMLFRTSGNLGNPGLGADGEQSAPRWPGLTATAQPGDPVPAPPAPRLIGGPRR